MTDSGAHILIADDEETFRLSTAALLRREGYTCDCAADSEEALRLLPDRYDLLLADIRMPGNMELNFLRTVHARMPNLPMVIVTGYPSLPTALEAFRLATIDYLVKPVDMEQLKGAIVRAVERRRLSRALEAAADYSGALADTFRSIESSVGGPVATDSVIPSTWTPEQCMARALSDIGRLSELAGRILSAWQGSSFSRGTTVSQTDACRLLQCPRRDAYATAIRETLEVIQRTKQSFKSKELATLRIRLEALLKSQGDA